MTDPAISGPVPIELTAAPRFAPRVRRLALTSVVALGVVWALATIGPRPSPPVTGALALGWLLMPATLLASLGHPRLRLALVGPASLVTLGLLAICLGWRPTEPAGALGWLLLTAGVALGGGLGLWFWYRLVPVPRPLDDPFSPGRWILIGVHIGLVVTGAVLVAASLAVG